MARAARSLVTTKDARNKLIDRDATHENYSVDEIVAMIKAPNVVYSTTPNATMVFANFMFKTGLIKTQPATWKDFFFPVVHNLPGT
jgi:NitT/TauT family transport system substrate-binding protein